MFTSKLIPSDYYSSFIFIIGGAFQGKSLLSIKIAEHYTFSAVLGTDCFRNILRIQNPTKEILCSTSKLTKTSFNKQREQVSDLLHKVLQFYANRKEKLVIEGVHFSKDFLRFAKKHGAKCICLENQLSWEKKVYLKKITTPITRIIDMKTGVESYVNHSAELNIQNITYLHKEKKFMEIHNAISSDADILKIEKVTYKDINQAFLKICNILDTHF